MVRKMMRAGVFAALGMIAMMGSYGVAVSADEKLPDIKEIMKKGHAKTDGYVAQVGAAVKGEKWEDATKLATSLNAFGEALGKNKPPKGDAKSWETLTAKYATNTKAVLTAVEKKDAKGATAALGAIGGSCGACHKAHK